MTPTQQLHLDSKSPLKSLDFENFALDYFRAQFGAVGAVGCKIHYTQWSNEDNHSPFFALCQAVAHRLRQLFEFRPFVINIHGSQDGTHPLPYDFDRSGYYGLVVQFGTCTLQIFLYAGQSRVSINYTWPNLQPTSRTHGIGFTSSHSSNEFCFDLTEANSVDQITAKVVACCENMLTHIGATCNP